MIKKPRGWEQITPASPNGIEKIPAGGYVCKIVKAVVTPTAKGGEMLECSFDIAEGDFKDYYTNRFKADTASNDPSKKAKWRGILRCVLPEDGNENDWKARQLKALAESAEKSNAGYTWTFDENTLRGLTIGVLYRDEEYDYKGYHGFSARPYLAIPADDARAGNFELPKAKTLSPDAGYAQFTPVPQYQQQPIAGAGAPVDYDDSELPF